MISPEKLQITDFLIVKKTGSWLFYQEVNPSTSKMTKNDIQMLDGFCSAIKQFANFFSDSFTELNLKNSKILVCPGKKVDCYIRLPAGKKLDNHLITSIFNEIVLHFEKKYSHILDLKENNPEMFDGFSRIIKEKKFSEISKPTTKSSEIIKKFLGVELNADKARKIISQL